MNDGQSMRASHDTMLINLTSTLGKGYRGEVVVRTGATVQQVLADVLDCSLDDVEVEVNGRSVSRLTPLLAGDRMVVSPSSAGRRRRPRAR